MESITFKGLEFPSAWYAQLGFENKDDWKIIFGDIGKIRQVLAKKLGVPHKNIAVNISK